MSKDVDEQLEDENEAEGHVELISHLAQMGRRSIAERHLAAELRLEDAHQEVLRGPHCLKCIAQPSLKTSALPG